MGLNAVAPWVLISSMLLGCGGGQAGSKGSKSPDDEPKIAAPNPEQRQMLALFQRLGIAIYQQDIASARGTDAMMELTGGEPDTRVRGWVTLDTPSGFRVLFVAPVASELLVIYDVDVPRGGRAKAVLVDPPAPASPEVTARFRAQQAVNTHGFRPCSDRYNQVVLPATLVGETGWLVYALAATVDPNARIIGGHHRFLVSEDGARVLKSKPLSKDCMTLEAEPDAVAMMVSTLISDLPNEGHYFASLLYDTPIYVLAGGQLWKVAPGN
jgi:hypothetical protein